MVRSVAIYRRGRAWQPGLSLRRQPTLLDHGAFLLGLEQAGTAEHAGPCHRLDEVPAEDPIGIVAFAVSAAEARAIVADDPGIHSGLLDCEIVPWYVSGA
jgi:uncharacterized protein YciI